MTSVDVSPYVDLTVFDQDPQTLFELSRNYMQFVFPNYNPVETNIEVVLMESLALMVNQAVFAINRVPGAVVEVLLQLFGIVRDIGHAPVVTLQFNMINDAGYTIPAGTQLSYFIGTNVITFATDIDLVVPAGDTFAEVSATGNINTPEFNGTALGTELTLTTSIPGVDSIVTTTPIQDGADPEDDTTYFNRGIGTLSRLTQTLVLPSHFTAFALSDDVVTKATTVDLYNPSVGPPGSNPGHVTVAVYGIGGFVSSGGKSALAAQMQTKCLASLQVHVVDPTITTVNVTTAVHTFPGFLNGDVIASVTAALNNYLATANWNWNNTVRVFELASLIDQIPGVDYVASIAVPSTDVTLSGVANLTQPGAITVTTV